MALSATTLSNELRKFMDKEYASFEDFPADETEAKTKWGNALQAYLDEIEVVSPPTISDTQNQIGVSSCGSTFGNALVFTVPGTIITSATSVSTAWAAAMATITPTPTAEYLGAGSGSLITLITLPFPTIAAQQAALLASVTSVFSDISIGGTAKSKCGDLASAIHTATSACVTTTCTYVNPAAPPPTLTGPLAFG